MPVKAPLRKNYTSKKPAKHIIKVYWPYLPLVITFGLIIGLSSYWKPLVKKHGVLAYASGVSQESLLINTNQQRLANGSGALSINQKLVIAAQTKANDMATKDYWAHKTPDGKEPWFFFDQAGYKYFKAGENLAYGFLNSESTIDGWMNSEGHRHNLLDNDFKEVGFGVANVSNYQGKGNATIVVAEYARPITSTIQISNAERSSSVTPFVTYNPLVSTSAALSVSNSASAPSKRVAAIQTASHGYAPWSAVVAGIIIGAVFVYAALKHALNLKRFFINSERFVLHHPLLDITLVIFAVFLALMNQTAGFIR